MSNVSVYPFLTGFLSQWNRSDFTVGGIAFGCAEQFMMYRKAVLFDDHEMAARILRAERPSDQKRLGQNVRGFVPSVWAERRVPIVLEGNRAKFSQNAGLRKKLLATGDSILVEANPKDFIWGAGLAQADPDILDPSKWQGLNLLGRILMQVRDELRQAPADSAS
jgi:hypothetical protein